MAERRFGVGYALAPKKQRSFIQDTLVSLARSRGIDLIPVDGGTPLADQGPFDVVIHKLYGDDWRRQLSEFSVRNPRSIVIDQPEAIERLHNRISMLSVVTELEVAEPGPAVDDHRSETVGIPKQKVIYDKESLLERPALEGRLKFPVVAKPLVADGSAMSHMMNLVFKQEGLHALEPPVVLQEFINHGGLIFKVYVAGDHVQCVKRISLPDVTEEGPATERQLLSFSQVSNLAKDERADDKYYKKMRLDEAEMPPEGFLVDISRRLRRALGLNLFNFDVIRDSSNGNRYLIIDINYFPGYGKMPGYEKLLTDFFCDLRTKLLGPAEAKEGDSRCGDGDEGVLPEEPRSRDDKNR